MKTETIMAEMPILSIVTNFDQNGDFERVYLVKPRGKGRQANHFREIKNLPMDRLWNGPMLLKNTYRE